MNPPWGINWQRYHADRLDMPHIERMGYKAFTIYEWMWSDRDFVAELVSHARPDALFINRDHPLSEQKGDMAADPRGTGRRHADEWAQKVREGRVYTPLDRTYFLGINEPDSHQYQRQIDAYNEAFCRRMAEHGLRAAAYSFGVGQPSTVDLRSDTPPDWSWYAASAAAVLEGGHIAALHEYGPPRMGEYGWGYWCNRSMHCPYPFDVVLDECGIDNGVLQSGELYGWAKYLKPEEYLVWLDGFQHGMAERAHTRKVNILAYNIFSYDHGSGETKDWHSFDIRPLRGMIEDYPWRGVIPAQPSGGNDHNVYVPTVGGPTAPAKPPTGTVTGGPQQPTPQPDTWARSRAFVRRWEGGFQDFDWDAGNWTGCKVGVGEKKGTNYGISACSYPHLDIRNITLAQADDIYFRDYWQASGADKLPWPGCLIVFDTAVLHGTGTAQKWLAEVGPNPYLFAAKRLSVYPKLDAWPQAGAAWVRRVAELLQEAAHGA